MDASERTLVTVTANAFYMNTLWFGCPPNGCVATNTRDGDLSTRWSCKKYLLDGTDCAITYMFEEPQDIVLMLIAFYKGDERTRALNIYLNGSPYTVIESSGKTEWFEVFELNTNHTETLALEALDLRGNEWISITEVRLRLYWSRQIIAKIAEDLLRVRSQYSSNVPDSLVEDTLTIFPVGVLIPYTSFRPTLVPPFIGAISGVVTPLLRHWDRCDIHIPPKRRRNLRNRATRNRATRNREIRIPRRIVESLSPPHAWLHCIPFLSNKGFLLIYC